MSRRLSGREIEPEGFIVASSHVVKGTIAPKADPSDSISFIRIRLFGVPAGVPHAEIMAASPLYLGVEEAQHLVLCLVSTLDSVGSEDEVVEHGSGDGSGGGGDGVGEGDGGSGVEEPS